MVKKTGKILKSLSFGVVLILLQIWIYTQIPEWRSKIQIYLLMTAFVFSFGSTITERAFLKASFIKALPKMLLFFIGTFLLLFVAGRLIGGGALSTVAKALTSVPFYLLLIHGFIIAVDEELIFRGWLSDNLRKKLNEKTTLIITAIVFALFHFFMAGRSWIVIIPYIALGLLFGIIKKKYSPVDNSANIGVHWGWNIFILAFGEILLFLR